MALFLTQPASGTLTFPNTTVGASSNGIITFESTFDSNLHHVQSYTITNVAITGPGAAAYSEVISLKGNNFTASGAQESETVRFAPSSVATFNATITFTYSAFDGFGRLITGGNQFPVFLVGAGVTGGGGTPASGEAPAMLQAFRRELIPVNSLSGGIVLAYFDETTFNDPLDGRTYVFKAQDILADRMPTVRRVIITYIDLGVATVLATVTGVDDTGALVTASASVTLGTAGATNRLMTAFFDLTMTGFRPQLTLSQVANGGPFLMSTAMMTGTIEQEVTL